MRTENWTHAEKEFLLECVDKFKVTVESKSNDVKIVKEKQAAWKGIEQMFRENGYTRDMERIKQQWKRMKFAAKKNISNSEKEIKTESDTNTSKSIPSETDIRIRNLCPDLTTEAHKNVVHSHPVFRKKLKRLSQFEMEQIRINKMKVEQHIRQQEELHEEMMYQLQIERKRKEVDLETALLKKQKILLEISMLKND